MLKKLYYVLFVCIMMLSQPAAASSEEAYTVTGFRNLKFGITEEQARKILINELQVKAGDVQRSENPVEGTVLLIAPLNKLEGAPGPGMIYSTFGHKSKKLIQVNLVWNSSEATEESQNLFSAAAIRFSQYFDNFKWTKNEVIKMQATTDNAITVFAAKDAKLGAVKVMLDGVQYESLVNGQKKKSSPPKFPPVLQIVYLANYENPDIIQIAKGSF